VPECQKNKNRALDQNGGKFFGRLIIGTIKSVELKALNGK